MTTVVHPFPVGTRVRIRRDGLYAHQCALPGIVELDHGFSVIVIFENGYRNSYRIGRGGDPCDLELDVVHHWPKHRLQ